MEFIGKFMLLFEIIAAFVFVILVVFLIRKRIKDKKNEDFEKRNW